MTESNRYYAYFTVTGDFDPAEVTLLMDVEPTEVWIKGSRNERTHMERKFSRWSLFSRLERTEAIESHIGDVVLQLKPKIAAVLQLGEQFNTEVPVVAYFHESYPGMHLNPALLRDLSDLNLGLDFDFYYMYSDKREDS